MNFRTTMVKPAGPTALAQESDFALGRLSVSPSRLEVRDRSRSEILQPRVMQVLTCLAHRRGEVVSRDELVASCWGGRAISEDAINRCIAGIRRLADDSGAFTVETVRRVGYRLDVPGNADAVGPAPTSGKVVLAVLAFDNLSGDPDMAYFSDGVSEEILLTVAASTGLSVIGRGSSFQFRGAEKAASHIAAVLKATHLLDGSVRRSGSKLRITANLVECQSQTTLWTGRFDRELSDVFALQDEIAAAVADALKVAFGSIAPAEFIDPAAYDLYLRALEVRNRGLEADTRIEIIGLLRAATDRAPGFARAWAFLARMLAGHLRFDEPDVPRVGNRADVIGAAETALRLDPRLGTAYQALGNLEAFGSYARREALHHKALSVAPNDPTVLTNASLFFAEIGRMEDALGYARRAWDIDPMYPWAANWYATMLDYTGRLEEGRALWVRFCKLWPNNELIAWNAIAESAARRDWAWFDELVGAAEAHKFSGPRTRRIIAYGKAVRAFGPDVQARAMRRAMETLRTTGTLPHSTFTFFSRVGLNDQAFELIGQASFDYIFDPEIPTPNGRVDDGLIFAVSHNLAMMRDIRFVGLCDKLGLCDYWLKSGRWPDCADAVAPWYEFRSEAVRLVEEKQRK